MHTEPCGRCEERQDPVGDPKHPCGRDNLHAVSGSGRRTTRGVGLYEARSRDDFGHGDEKQREIDCEKVKSERVEDINEITGAMRRRWSLAIQDREGCRWLMDQPSISWLLRHVVRFIFRGPAAIRVDLAV